jgi:hypothetical protein
MSACWKSLLRNLFPVGHVAESVLLTKSYMKMKTEQTEVFGRVAKIWT